MADEAQAFPDRGPAYGPSDMDIWQAAGGWLNRKETQAARERATRMQPPKPMESE